LTFGKSLKASGDAEISTVKSGKAEVTEIKLVWPAAADGRHGHHPCFIILVNY